MSLIVNRSGCEKSAKHAQRIADTIEDSLCYIRILLCYLVSKVSVIYKFMCRISDDLLKSFLFRESLSVTLVQIYLLGYLILHLFRIVAEPLLTNEILKFIELFRSILLQMVSDFVHENVADVAFKVTVHVDVDSTIHILAISLTTCRCLQVINKMDVHTKIACYLGECPYYCSFRRSCCIDKYFALWLRWLVL